MSYPAELKRVSVTGPIIGVVVHGRGAVITRRLEVEGELPATPVDLVLAGITPLADPGSVRVSLPDESRPLVGVNARIDVPSIDEGPGPTADRLKRLNRKIDRLVERQSALEERSRRLREFMLAPVSRRAVTEEGPLRRLESSLSLSEVVAETIDHLDQRVVDLRDELQRLQRERDEAELEDRQASSEARMGESHPTRRFEIRIGAGEGSVDGAELSYAVPYAAKWWPLYSLRLTEGGRAAHLTMEALVAQRTGEDWSNVPVGLSTAEIVFDATLPNLPSLRLGKRQRSPRGFRAPPPGTAELFSGYDAFRGPGAGPPLQKPSRLQQSKPKRRREARVDDAAAQTGSFADFELADEPHAPPPGGAQMEASPIAAPARSRSRLSDVAEKFMAAPSEVSRSAIGRFGGPSGAGGGPGGRDGDDFDESATARFEPGNAWLEFDSLVLAGPDEPGRGQLKRRPDRGDSMTSELYDAQESAQRMGLNDPIVSRGVFDYRYDSSGVVRVPADGRLHRVSLDERETESRLVWRTVPVSDPAVYREAELDNPFESPLLAGPVDVFSAGQLVTTTSIDRVDTGGSMRVGLGVDERIRVARNVRMAEESAGLLGGKRQLGHVVEIELRSGLGFDARVEVIDRVPVTHDDNVNVDLVESVPVPEEYDQSRHEAPVEGGLRWSVELEAGRQARVEYRYDIVLRAKDELVGGNRRE